jgi:hypothetical protein
MDQIGSQPVSKTAQLEKALQGCQPTRQGRRRQTVPDHAGKRLWDGRNGHHVNLVAAR